MPATKKTSYARYTLAATGLLGRLIQTQRKLRRMTAQELAERLGTSRGTVQRLERGDPKVETGIAFDACTILGIALFEDDLPRLTARLDDANARLTLLPKYARPTKQAVVDDDF